MRRTCQGRTPLHLLEEISVNIERELRLRVAAPPEREDSPDLTVKEVRTRELAASKKEVLGPADQLDLLRAEHQRHRVKAQRQSQLLTCQRDEARRESEQYRLEGERLRSRLLQSQQGKSEGRLYAVQLQNLQKQAKSMSELVCVLRLKLEAKEKQVGQLEDLLDARSKQLKGQLREQQERLSGKQFELFKSRLKEEELRQKLELLNGERGELLRRDVNCLQEELRLLSAEKSKLSQEANKLRSVNLTLGKELDDLKRRAKEMIRELEQGRLKELQMEALLATERERSRELQSLLKETEGKMQLQIDQGKKEGQRLQEAESKERQLRQWEARLKSSESKIKNWQREEMKQAEATRARNSQQQNKREEDRKEEARHAKLKEEEGRLLQAREERIKEQKAAQELQRQVQSLEQKVGEEVQRLNRLTKLRVKDEQTLKPSSKRGEYGSEERNGHLAKIQQLENEREIYKAELIELQKKVKRKKAKGDQQQKTDTRDVKARLLNENIDNLVRNLDAERAKCYELQKKLQRMERVVGGDQLDKVGGWLLSFFKAYCDILGQLELTQSPEFQAIRELVQQKVRHPEFDYNESIEETNMDAVNKLRELKKTQEHGIRSHVIRSERLGTENAFLKLLIKNKDSSRALSEFGKFTARLQAEGRYLPRTEFERTAFLEHERDREKVDLQDNARTSESFVKTIFIFLEDIIKVFDGSVACLPMLGEVQESVRTGFVSTQDQAHVTLLLQRIKDWIIQKIKYFRKKLSKVILPDSRQFPDEDEDEGPLNHIAIEEIKDLQTKLRFAELKSHKLGDQLHSLRIETLGCASYSKAVERLLQFVMEEGDIGGSEPEPWLAEQLEGRLGQLREQAVAFRRGRGRVSR